MDKKYEDESLCDISSFLRELVRLNEYRLHKLTMEGQVVVYKLGEIAERIDAAAKRDAQRIERRTIDTDLYEWFGDVEFSRESPSYPYPGQCNVPHKDRFKRGLCVDRKTLDKIRDLLRNGKVTVI